MPGNAPPILLVEDNEDHAEITRRCLGKLTPPPALYHVSHGEAALAYLFRRAPYEDPSSSPAPVVILLDLRLPRLSGLEVLREIKKDPHLKSIPVIALTSSDRHEDMRLAYELHVNAYLVKPVDFKAFHQLIVDFGRFWLKWNRNPRRRRRDA